MRAIGCTSALWDAKIPLPQASQIRNSSGKLEIQQSSHSVPNISQAWLRLSSSVLLGGYKYHVCKGPSPSLSPPSFPNDRHHPHSPTRKPAPPTTPHADAIMSNYLEDITTTVHPHHINKPAQPSPPRALAPPKSPPPNPPLPNLPSLTSHLASQISQSCSTKESGRLIGRAHFMVSRRSRFQKRREQS